MRRLGDRRDRIRLEVVGSLWGTLEVGRRARVVNINRGGALIASPFPTPVDSTLTVQLTLDGEEVKLRSRVRHVNHMAGAGDEGAHYQIGLEFLETPVALIHVIE